MELATHDIGVLVDEIWMATLGLPTHESAPGEIANAIEGVVQITGDWQGTVVVRVDRQLAARAASVMFRLGEAVPSLVDMQDALGEITNMTGGNIKGLMHGKCQLSLPTVIEGPSYTVRVPTADLVSMLSFESEGLKGEVRVLASRAQEPRCR